MIEEWTTGLPHRDGPENREAADPGDNALKPTVRRTHNPSEEESGPGWQPKDGNKGERDRLSLFYFDSVVS